MTPNPPKPLVMRSYRRHRRQSRWGTASLFAPPVALLWGVFWYLMMNRQQAAGAVSTGISTEAILLSIGCAAISLAGAAVALAGMLDGYHKRGRAATGLAVNAVILVGTGVLFFLRAFAQSVG